jgi:hypothetical protein
MSEPAVPGGPAAGSGTGRRYRWGAAILFVVGLLLLGWAAVSFFAGQQVAFVDGQVTAVADRGERWWVAAPADARLRGLSCAASISGEGVSLQRVPGDQEVTVDGAQWRTVLSLTAQRPGDLVVTCTTTGAVDLALVRDQSSATAGGAVLIPAILGLALLGAAAGGTWWLLAGRSGRSAEERDAVDSDPLQEPPEPPEG